MVENSLIERIDFKNKVIVYLPCNCYYLLVATNKLLKGDFL